MHICANNNRFGKMFIINKCGDNAPQSRVNFCFVLVTKYNPSKSYTINVSVAIFVFLMVSEVRQIIRPDRQITIRELSDECNISHETMVQTVKKIYFKGI